MKRNQEDELRMSDQGVDQEKANPESLENQALVATHIQAKEKVQASGQNLQVSDYKAFREKASKEQILSIFQFMEMKEHGSQEQNFTQISALRCTRRQLINLAVNEFCKNTWAQTNLTKSVMQALTQKIAQGYHNVSYHNFSHGFTLIQIFHRCLRKDEKLAGLVSQQEKILYYFAGLAHDINHRGTNNQFQISMNTKLAEQAQNEGVLEKMHAQTFFQLLRDNPNIDIIAKSSNPQNSKKLILQAILATDMGKHAKHLNQLKSRRENKTLNFTDYADKQFVLCEIFHACDIGTGTLQFQELMNWSALLMSEFDHQTQLEAENKVKISTYMKFQGNKDFFKGQSSFLNSLVLPLWRQISLNFKGLTPLAQKIEQNSQKFLALSENEQ